MSVAVKMIYSERNAQRLEVEFGATLRGAAAHPVDVDVEDISVSGFRVLTSEKLRDGELITIGLAGLGMQPALVVRSVPDGYGCQFINTVSQSYIDQLGFENPNTITPFAASKIRYPSAHQRPVYADSRYPGWQRLLIITGLGAIGWTLLYLAVALLSFV